MNKKGFTLAELLGVIVVLSIIVSIAGLSVISVMNKAKNKTFAEMTDNLKDAAKTCYLDNLDNLDKESVAKNCGTVKKLKDNGYFEDNKDYCNNVTIYFSETSDGDDYQVNLEGKCGN